MIWLAILVMTPMICPTRSEASDKVPITPRAKSALAAASLAIWVERRVWSPISRMEEVSSSVAPAMCVDVSEASLDTMTMRSDRCCVSSAMRLTLSALDRIDAAESATRVTAVRMDRSKASARLCKAARFSSSARAFSAWPSACNVSILSKLSLNTVTAPAISPISSLRPSKGMVTDVSPADSFRMAATMVDSGRKSCMTANAGKATARISRTAIATLSIRLSRPASALTCADQAIIMSVALLWSSSRTSKT